MQSHDTTTVKNFKYNIMFAKTRWKNLNGHDRPSEFQINKTVTLPLLSESRDAEGEKQTFMADGLISGIPVLAQIATPDKKVKQLKGVLLKHPKGVYVIPDKYVKSAHSNAEGDQLETTAQDVIESTEQLAQDVIIKPLKETVEPHVETLTTW